ncbi:SDR family oxidoreductase [Rhodococcus pseudokoreensis]|uniref:SDR family oxidoreductase n=1 Tax=Rhodococcus pseudokoreensis TaxID=2811421 RepID=UPI001F12743D|nr:SDR family oxidoreductase [Rhodococcus pseudokoreensis]
MVSEHILVTGGSRGIGAAVVRLAVHRGYQVTLTYQNDDEAADHLMHHCGIRATAVRADVRDAALAAAVVGASDERGQLVAVVNNAGTTGPLGPFLSTSDASLREVFDVNVFGTINYARAAAEHWVREGRPGVIVNLSSVAAGSGAPGEYVGYAASKAAVDSLTTGLGRELAAANIRVVGVAPGTTDTDIHAAAGDPGRPERVAGRIPLGRVATPEEIAEAVLWALSHQASYVTATTIAVAGGL